MYAAKSGSTYVVQIRVEEVGVLVVKLVKVFGVLGHHLIVLLDEALRWTK